MKLRLRDYQTEALCVLLEYAKSASAAENHRILRTEAPAECAARRLLCIQPTGAGKTVLILAFVAEVSRRFGWKSLLVVPSRALVAQTIERAAEFFPDLKVSRIVGGSFDLTGDFVVATQASLAGEKLRRIPQEFFSLLVADEAHHAAARSYREILDYFSLARLQIGVTATHIRGDGENIASEDYFGVVAIWNTVSQLTRAGFLVPAFGYYAQTSVSLEGLKIKNGDFCERQLSRTVNNAERNGLAVAAYFEHLKNRPTVCFAVDVTHAKDLAAGFNQNGVRAEAVWGAMSREIYAGAMRRFETGETQILVNAKLLVEGWDSPHTSGVLVARPATETTAAVLGPQMIGRALRPCPRSGKRDAVIVELRDRRDDSNTANFGFQKTSLLGTLAETSEEDDFSSRIPLHEQADYNRAKNAWREREKLRGSLLNGEDVPHFFDVIEEIERVSLYAWVPLGACLYMPLEDGEFLEIVEAPPVSCFEIRGCFAGDFQVIGTARTRGEALSIADAWLSAHVARRQRGLIRRDQPWRNRAATEKQILRAAELTGLSVSNLSRLTSGQISDLIRSAYALLLSPEELIFARSRISVSLPPSFLNPHAWQIGDSLSV